MSSNITPRDSSQTKDGPNGGGSSGSEVAIDIMGDDEKNGDKSEKELLPSRANSVSKHSGKEIAKEIMNILSNLTANILTEAKKNEISVLGSIAAGTPIEAIQNEVSRIPLPSNIENNGEFFGLKVKGDSMIEAGINDGDTVIIKKADKAENGKIVVALIDDHEAMLKRIRIKGKTVALESANRNYETKIFGPDRVKVQGVLISLYRNFN